MPTFVPAQLATWTGGRWTAQPKAELAGFTMDTRQLRAGQVFVALKTDKRDGHEFLAAAQASGASAALVSTPNATLALPQLVVADPLAAFQAIAREHRRAFRGPVIGISGSAGKTSTKNLLALLLGGEAGGVLSTEGNLNNHIGVPLTLTRLDPAKHTFAVVEAGISAPGEMKILASMIEPDVALVTLVAAAHTEELGGLEGVAREKAVLPSMVRPSGVAVFPKSCTQFAAFRDMFVNQLVLERSDVLRPATQPRHTIHFNVLQRAGETVIVIAYGPPPPAMFKMSRVSDGMAQNAALALTTALRLGVAPDVLQKRLANWTAAPLRGEIRRENGRLLYLDCYNANPASMADALATFHAIAPPSEPRLYVLGSMEELGDDSAALHRALGRQVNLRDGDRLLVIGTHANDLCAGVLEQGDFSRQIQIVSTIETIAAVLAEWPGAVFVKGSRRYQLERALGDVPQEAVHA
ncbi:MAG: UDP-N-acetylmuramoylalanyl-D-glutamyl-2,6-diaminopimelate--D-alanyl-D-alanyl ligase [Verrucomicrobia bacterium]|nr:UDP-N-acetylmuramoylalanyl-D-glutamyl-2,6-diaminopimelate--D-alanyl-D-alanyl ligase [Verrucomicrobiota bacterium]